jgi:hypothetical protein
LGTKVVASEADKAAKTACLDDDRLVISVGGQQHVLVKPSQPSVDVAGIHAASTDLHEQFRSEAPLTPGVSVRIQHARPR